MCDRKIQEVQILQIRPEEQDYSDRPWSSTGPSGSTKYPIVSLEDGLAEDDWDGWADLTEEVGSKCHSSATTCSSPTPNDWPRASKKGCANSILIKVNQIGTLTETLEAIDLARRNGYTAVMSHRSGETEDSTIADLAVATGVGQIKTARPAGPTASASTTNCCGSTKI